MKTNIGSWRFHARTKLPGEAQEVQITVDAILKKVLNRDLAWILTHLDDVISDADLKILDGYITQLQRDMPLPYVIGETEFFNLPFFVNPNVLIPRPETEILVELVLDWLQKNETQNQKKFLDIGTGSGCIPISIIKNYPKIIGYGVERSWEAIKIAKKNKDRHAISNLHLFQGDLFGAVKKKFDVISGNLPYIPTKVYKNLRVAKFEPRIALDGGDDGLLLYRRIFSKLSLFIQKPGLCVFEIHHDQGEILIRIAENMFSWNTIKIIKDYSGNDRFIYLEA